MNKPILKIENLVKRFGGFGKKKTTVIDDLSFEINEGEIVALLGGNGAGKSTTFDMLAGIAPPSDGRILFRKSPSSLNTDRVGDDLDRSRSDAGSGNASTASEVREKWIPIMKMPLHQRAQNGIIYLPQKTSIFGGLTVRQNLLGIMEVIDSKDLINGMRIFDVKSGSREEFCDKMLEEFHLTPVMNTKAGRVSGGERRRLEIVRSFIRNPRLILMDEPYAALDVPGIKLCSEFFCKMKTAGVSILLVDHKLDEVLKIADWVVYLTKDEKGCIQGPPWAIVRHPKAESALFSGIAREFQKEFPIPEEVRTGRISAVTQAALGSNRDWLPAWKAAQQRFGSIRVEE